MAFTHGGGCGMQFGGEARHAQPRAGRHRPASEHRRLRAHRAGLRNGLAGLPARRSAAGADRRREVAAVETPAGVDHAGPRRHDQDGRGRRAAGRRRCCREANDVRREPIPLRVDPGHRLRRLGRQLGRHGQSGPGRGQRHDRGRRRHRRSWARPPKSTAPNICSRAAPARPRWPRS